MAATSTRIPIHQSRLVMAASPKALADRHVTLCWLPWLSDVLDTEPPVQAADRCSSGVLRQRKKTGPCSPEQSDGPSMYTAASAAMCARDYGARTGPDRVAQTAFLKYFRPGDKVLDSF